MGAENKRRVKYNLRQDICISIRQSAGHSKKYSNFSRSMCLLVLGAKKSLCVFKFEFDQDSMRAALRISEQTDPNMAIPQTQHCLGAIGCEASQLQEKAKLDAMPTVSKFFLRRADGRFHDHSQVFHKHGGLFAAFPRQFMLTS